MIDFRQAILTLDNWGLTDVLLPFLLVFTITFAIFQKTQILGHKKFNIIIALVMGGAVVFPHITGNGPDVIPIINNALPSVGTVSIALIMVLFLLGLLGLPTIVQPKGLGGYIAFILIGIVGYIFAVSAGWVMQSSWLNFLFDSDTQALIVIILVFGIIISFVTGEDESTSKKTLGELMNETFAKPVESKKPGEKQ